MIIKPKYSFNHSHHSLTVLWARVENALEEEHTEERSVHPHPILEIHTLLPVQSTCRILTYLPQSTIVQGYNKIRHSFYSV